ncbi:MAG TPA: hypothetical protein VGV67_03775, partial [Solirubrobacteraceae bacterium]|nr:hypothetical protein [Solirubrobacteraceae bacterium]
VLLCAALAAAPAGAATRPLVTAVADSFVDGPDYDVMLKRMRGAGATATRFWVTWADIAPAGETKPAGFDASNPADPAYRWEQTDRALRAVRAAGLEPIMTISEAPRWAERFQPGDELLSPSERFGGTVRPDGAEFALFARAIATRYGGSFAGLPRVRYWQPWNEPNHHNDLNPQFDIAPGQPATTSTPMLSPAIYRELLQGFARAAHGVHADNVVIAGGLAPFFRPSPGGRASAPLKFARELLCMDDANRPKPSCPGGRLEFDAWSQHPYTSGDARHSANSPFDVSLGDIPEVVRLVRAAERAGRVSSRRAVRMFVTEFSWDSSPPDAYGVPDKLLTRWVAEALHELWHDGVELVTWFQIRDAIAPPQGIFQSGLYLRCAGGVACDRPKPMLAAFRFPFTAYRSAGRVKVWGRTPSGRRGTVVVQQRRGPRWVRIARLRSDVNGIFERAQIRLQGAGDVRARVAGRTQSSPAFSLRRVPDRPVNPFGNFPVDEP